MRTSLSIVFASILYVCASTQVTSELTSKVVLTSEIKWTPLNPARGDKGPMAGTLWGDRTGSGPSGFLVKFIDSFSSPPHIHNITYRGVVISGLVHNDDPNAEKTWMPAGSYWTQAAGEVHITSAKGSSNIAYIEIEKSPYLVLPTNEAFKSSDKSINVEESNIVWLDASNTKWIKQPENTSFEDAPKIAFLWGKSQSNQLNGTFVKMPSGFSGKVKTNHSMLRGVIIQGNVNHQVKADKSVLVPGSYFSSEEEVVHKFSVENGKDCIIYIRSKGRFDVVMDSPELIRG